MTKNRPVHEVRFGAIKAAIWENQFGENTKFTVTFSRSYKDGEEWKNVDSFGRDDLLLVAKAADQAHSWIHAQRPNREPSPPSNPAPPAVPPSPPPQNRPTPNRPRSNPGDARLRTGEM